MHAPPELMLVIYVRLCYNMTLLCVKYRWAHIHLGEFTITLSKVAEMFSEIASSHVTLFVVDT